MSRQSNLQGMLPCMPSKQQRRGQHWRAGRWSLRRSRLSSWKTTETSGVRPASVMAENFRSSAESRRIMSQAVVRKVKPYCAMQATLLGLAKARRAGSILMINKPMTTSFGLADIAGTRALQHLLPQRRT